MNTKTIKVDYLARVEGEGSLIVKIKDKKVSKVQFKIFEPPRFLKHFCGDVSSPKLRISRRVSAASVRSRIR